MRNGTSPWSGDALVHVRNEYDVPLLPDTIAAASKLGEASYKANALPKEQKRLIAPGVAPGRGCTNCLVGQTAMPLQAGSTVDEIVEVIGVAVAVGGTMVMAESLRVIRLLEEMG